LVKSNIPHHTLLSPENPIVKIQSQFLEFVIISIYIPPGAQNIEDDLTDLFRQNLPVLLAGDFERMSQSMGMRESKSQRHLPQ